MSILPEGENGWKPKNKSSYRSFEMPCEVDGIFRAYRDKRHNESPSAYIFAMSDGRPFKDYPNFVYRRLVKALGRINRERLKNGIEPIPEFTPHTLRHWFIGWSLTRQENPLTEVELSQIVGHTDISMIREVYFHGDPQWDSARKMRVTKLFTNNTERSA